MTVQELSTYVLAREIPVNSTSRDLDGSVSLKLHLDLFITWVVTTVSDITWVISLLAPNGNSKTNFAIYPYSLLSL